MNTMNRPRKTVRRVGWDGKLLLASVDEVKYFCENIFFKIEYSKY